jgi:ketosteroid isomerase-like protein
MQSALEAIHEYYKAFSTLDLSAIASYYCEPSMTVAPQGVLSAENHAASRTRLLPSSSH